jgi:hypothetical protein
MQKNKELIKQLQTENKSLREQLKIKSRVKNLPNFQIYKIH